MSEVARNSIVRPKADLAIATSDGAVAVRPAGKANSYPEFKAVIDRVAAFFALAVTSPVLLLIAVAIRLESRGNPVFAQERFGKDGRRFVLYKFRSMYVKHDDTKYKEFIRKYVTENVETRLEDGQDKYQLLKDPRVTRVGQFLRKTNLDELPQFVNILKGEMSFIGPRPDTPYAVEMYQERHRQRFLVTPGITGLWQVSHRKDRSFEYMVGLDLEYIEKQSLALDLKIVFKTMGALLGGHGS